MRDNLKDVGIWGQQHYQYLKENRPTTVNVMRMNGTLNSYLREVNDQADERPLSPDFNNVITMS